jgi:peptide deformylase
MQMEILKYPNPLLKQHCARVTSFDHHLEKLIGDMFETMTAHNGVGLAAPQVGILEQVLIGQYKDKPFYLINPTLLAEEDAVMGEEACLSVPDFSVNVTRANNIIVETYNIQGEKIQIQETGMVARIIQHEIDHLNGILIVNKVPTKIPLF